MDLIKKPIIEEIRSLINNIVFQYATSQEDYRRVYVWGLAEHGALGTLGKTRIVDDVAYIGKPSRLYFGEKHKVVDDIGCGYGFFMFGVNSDDRKIVYGNGINTDSQIGK
ncbi:RCC1-like G exchanging factor-like protein [Venturia canescens]|nr:RCC1-like G exchanging factor-like protein [Venturia canescens]